MLSGSANCDKLTYVVVLSLVHAVVVQILHSEMRLPTAQVVASKTMPSFAAALYAAMMLFTLEILLASLALSRALPKATTASVANKPMIAMTTKSSMSVKPFLFCIFCTLGDLKGQ